MVTLSSIVQNLPLVIDIVLKITLLFVALFFGRIAVSGLRKKPNFIIRTAIAVLLGLICFAVGLILPFDLVPQIAFVSRIINSLIVAGILFVILFMVSLESKSPAPKVVGAVITIVFAAAVLSFMTPANLELVYEGFSFYGVDIKAETCPGPKTVLQNWNSNQNRILPDDYGTYGLNELIDEFIRQQITESIDSNMFVSSFIYDYPVVIEQDGIYRALFVTDVKIISMQQSLDVLQGSMINSMTSPNYICSVDMQNNELCGCEKIGAPNLLTQVTSFLSNLILELKEQQ